MQLQSENHFQREAGTAARRCVSDYNPPGGLKLGTAHRPIRAPEIVIVRVSLTVHLPHPETTPRSTQRTTSVLLFVNGSFQLNNLKDYWQTFTRSFNVTFEVSLLFLFIWFIASNEE